MTTSNLIRSGGLAAVVGGVVYAAVGLVEDRMLEYLYYTENIVGYGYVAVLLPIGAMAAIAALHTLHRELYGWLGAAVSLTAFVGLGLITLALTAGVVLDSPRYVDPLFGVLLMGLLLATVGTVLLGGLTIAAGVLPVWCGAALMAGNPIFVLATMLPSAALGGPSMLGGAFQALGGVPWALVGYALSQEAGRGTGHPARTR